GMVEEPIAVVAGDLRRFDVKASHLPVRADLLQDERDRVSALGRQRIENDHGVLSRRKVVEIKSRAVAGLAILAKNPTVKFRARNWRGAIGFQQERRTSRPLRAGQCRLIVLDRGLDGGKLG